MFILFFYLIVISLTAFIFIKLLLPDMRRHVLIRQTPSLDLQPISQEEKIEMICAQKNKQIQQLQTELKILQTKAKDFDNIKALLDQHIQRLKEENRNIKSHMLQPNVS